MDRILHSSRQFSAMDVKQRKPNMGGRRPSPKLWAMVRGLTEDHWRLVAAFSAVYGKGSLQFKLLTLLRSMEVYDPVAEKKAFEDNNLTSMRSTAKKWLVRTARRLALYQSEAYEQVLDLEVLMLWGPHDEYTQEAVEEAKQLATEQEEFTMLTSLYHSELKFVKDYYQGEERIKQIIRVCEEATKNGNLVQLGYEIERQAAMYYESARARLLADGKFDEEFTETYFQSEFFRQNIDGWPISYQIQKLRIDEGLHYFLGRTAEAAITAEKLLDRLAKLEGIRQRQTEDHARCLFRLSAYYSALGDKLKVVNIIEIIKEKAKAESPLQHLYLRRVVFSLLHAALEFDISTLGEEGLAVWVENKDLLKSLPRDLVQFETYLIVSFQYVSIGRTKEAREAFNLASVLSESFSFPSHQSVFRILHLMLLVDEDDERGLQSFGKRYKRHLVAYLKEEAYSVIAAVALEIVMILAKASNLEGKDKLHKSLRLLLEKLEAFQQLGDVTINPHIQSMIRWAEFHLR